MLKKPPLLIPVPRDFNRGQASRRQYRVQTRSISLKQEVAARREDRRFPENLRSYILNSVCIINTKESWCGRMGKISLCRKFTVSHAYSPLLIVARTLPEFPDPSLKQSLDSGKQPWMLLKGIFRSFHRLIGWYDHCHISLLSALDMRKREKEREREPELSNRG